jgi:hypothetical protein
VIGRTRKPGTYAAAAAASPSTFCDGLPPIDPAFTRVLNVTSMAAGGALCGAGWACKRVEVIVTRAGASLVTLDFMLVNY